MDLSRHDNFGKLQNSLNDVEMWNSATDMWVIVYILENLNLNVIYTPVHYVIYA
jgi:hypothetical protein